MVGDIDEEFIRSGEKVEYLPDGSVRIPGMMRAHKAECLVPFLMNGATTVGGCVIKHMSCIPKEGDRLIIAGRVLVVEKMDHNRVSSILLLPPEKRRMNLPWKAGWNHDDDFIILLLIVLNGLFVAAEFALLGAPRAALEQMGASGNMVARRVSQILKTPRLQDRYIATAQLGITFASLGLGMYGEHAVARWLHEWLAQYGWASWLVAHGAASVLSVAVLTYLHIVLGEMVPKALSLQYATKLCLIITMPMYVIQLCLYPLVVGMNTLGNFFLRLLGVDRNESKSHYHSAEELQYIIEESHENGALPQESGRIMDGLFDLEDLYVHQVMTPRVRIDAIPERAGHEQIREIVRRTRRTRYPVYRGDLDHVVGMVHARDLFRIMLRGKALTSEYIHAIPKVPKTVKFDNVVEIMRKDNVRLAIILDEHGGTSGLLTLTDVFPR